MPKTLNRPVGSLLAGPADVIAAARDERQRLGGGMRQAGGIAAAGVVAPATQGGRRGGDRARGARLAEVVAERWPDAGLEPAEVRTNVVVFSHPDPGRLVAYLR